MCRIESDKIMLSNIICQICEDQSPLFSLFDRGAVDLNVVGLPININSLLLVIDDVGCGNYSAVSNAKMEKSQKVIHILGRKEIWNFHRKIKPSRNTDLGISTWDTSIRRNIFLDLHMHLISVRIKIKHDRLLSESILVMNLGSNLIQILVDRLLNVKNRCLNSVDMILDPLESPKSLLDLPVRPHRLDTISCSFLNDNING